MAFSPDAVQSSGVGTRSYIHADINDTVVSSAVLENSVFTTPIAAGQKVHIHYSLPFSLAGTAPGIKFQVTTPVNPVLYSSVAKIYNGAGDSLVLVDNITTAAAQGFTLAATGNHYAEIDFDLQNGSTAGSVVLQFAQNVSNSSNTILQKGAWADVTKY